MSDRKVVFTSSNQDLQKGDTFKRESANASETYRVVRRIHIDKTGAAHYEAEVVKE